MRVVLKTIDPVALNYAANVLSQEGIESVVFDTHASVMDGSMGFLPRRLMVLDEDFARADALLRDAVPDAFFVSETFLDGRVRAAQPQAGFRSGLDAVMLAASVPATAGQSVLELGSGAGTGTLCLAARVPGLALAGVEIDESLIALARANAVANASDATFTAADIFALPPALKRDFDHVFANPPFHGEGQSSPDVARATALMDDGKLGDWLKLGLQRTLSGGYFTTILRADRLNEALAALPLRGVCAFPLWPHAGEAPKRVIVQARKGSAAPFALLAGLVLHRPDGSWTDEADAVLRRGTALALSEARL